MAKLPLLNANDVILCLIASSRSDNYSITLENKDFKSGKLDVQSHIRSNRLFTADESLISYKIGTLKENKIEEVIQKIERILRK